MTPEDSAPLLDFAALRGRLRRLLPLLAALAVVGAGLDVAAGGLSAGVLLRWATVLAVLVLVALAVLTAVHALSGADRAQRRGERLAGHDVGLVPTRRPEGSDLGLRRGRPPQP